VARSRPLVLVLSVLTLSTLGILSQPTAGARQQFSSTIMCGKWRWPVKTLSDKRERRVNFSPRNRTVGVLRGLQAPSALGSTTPRILHSAEVRTYRVHVAIIGAARMDDHDIHLVIAPRAHHKRTMITEFPDTACNGAVSSPKKAAMKAARAALVDTCPPIGSTFKKLAGKATLIGVGFFDDVHGQPGVAPNGIELHPVLSFTGTCKSS